MSYKPGDKVWAVVDKGHSTIAAGSHKAVVLSGPVGPYTPRWDRYAHCTWYEVDIEDYPVTKGPWRVPEQLLIPRHDPYEGDQAGSWDNCPYFNPLRSKIDAC